LRRKDLVSIAGSLSRKDAKTLRKVSGAVRGNWR